MPTSQNGWSASASLDLRPFVVNGISFPPGIRDNADVETVLRYVVEQFAARVEPLINPGCWGFSYRENRNDPNALSNHASGTAVDVNAPKHPNGVPTSRTFTSAQISEVHQILAEVSNVVRWGGDYHGTPDAMHFEINASRASVDAIATHIRQKEEDAMQDADWVKLRAIVREESAAAIKAELDTPVQTKKGKRSVRQMLREMFQR